MILNSSQACLPPSYERVRSCLPSFHLQSETTRSRLEISPRCKIHFETIQDEPGTFSKLQ